MHDTSFNIPCLEKGSEDCKLLSGAVNLIARVIPLIFEEKEFFMRSMWHE